MFANATPLLRTVHAQVADQIGATIVRGDVAPGDALPSEMRICDMMAVSRTVVREAIRVLAGKGLVVSRAKSGTRVRPPEEWNQLDPDVLRWQLESANVDSYLAKLFQLRHAVEPAAAALAATAATPADLTRLRASFEAMVTAPDDAAFVGADVDFHKNIYFATRNEFFWPIAQMFEMTLGRSFAITAPGDHRPRGIAEHGDVLAAIERRDPEAARAATMVLLDSSRQDLIRMRGEDTQKAITSKKA